MHNIWKEGPICLFNGVIDKRRYYAHRHAILALRGDEIEPLKKTKDLERSALD